jgi:hypothetical protein
MCDTEPGREISFCARGFMVDGKGVGESGILNRTLTNHTVSLETAFA